MTAATQPSLEDLLLGAMPWLPKVGCTIHFSLMTTAKNSWRIFIDAAKGKLAPFILVIEGSIPDEGNKKEGYWASFGTDQKTGQPITDREWIDKLAPKAWAVVAAGTCATYGGIHAMAGNPTGAWACRTIWDGNGNRNGDSDRMRAGVSGAAGQLHGDAAVSAEHGCGQGADDSVWTRRCDPPGCSVPRYMKAATAVVITSRRNLPEGYGGFNAL